MITLTIKHETLYGAYAPEFGVSAWGGCQDEAINNLSEELELRGMNSSTGEEKRDAFAR